MNTVPGWAYVVALVVLVVGVSAMVFTFTHCGWKTFFLGSGGFYAASMGLCD